MLCDHVTVYECGSSLASASARRQPTLNSRGKQPEVRAKAAIIG